MTRSQDQYFRACHSLATRYASCVDGRDLVGFGRCFTADARFVIDNVPGSRPAGQVTLNGREAIVEFIGSLLDQLTTAVHDVCNVGIESVAGDEVDFHSRTLAVMPEPAPGSGLLVRAVQYRARAVLDDDDTATYVALEHRLLWDRRPR